MFGGSSLKELHTSPEKLTSAKIKCIAANTPMAQSLQTIFFRNQDRYSNDLGFNEPRLSETKLAEMCYLYRRTGLL